MGRSRRTLDRRTLRDQSEAAERINKETEEVEGGDEDEDEDEDEEEDEEGEEAEASGDDDEEGGDDDEEKPKPKPKKKKAPAKPKVTKPRTRATKVVRMRVVWGVFSNSHQLHEEFDYPRKKDAEDKVTQLNTDKKSGHPFFLQPVKKPMDK